MANEQMRQMTELTQLVKSLKDQHAAEIADVTLAHAIQIKELNRRLFSRSILTTSSSP